MGLEAEISKDEWDGIKPSIENQATRLECTQSILELLLSRLGPIVANNDAQIESCVARKISAYENVVEATTGAGIVARAKSPGWRGGTKTDTKSVCYTAGPNQQIVSATKTSLSCNQHRCSATEPAYSENNRKVCINVKAWSDSASFGAGGWAEYRLDISYKNIAVPEIRERFRAECASNNG